MSRRLIEACGVCAGLLLEPCAHVAQLKFGILIPHVEGMGAYIANYVTARR